MHRGLHNRHRERNRGVHRVYCRKYEYSVQFLTSLLMSIFYDAAIASCLAGIADCLTCGACRSRQGSRSFNSFTSTDHSHPDEVVEVESDNDNGSGAS